MSILEQLKSVLCDPSGKCCITGSDEDRAIVDRALQALAEHPAQQEPVAWMYVNTDGECEQIEYGYPFDEPDVIPLYTSPYTSPPAQQTLVAAAWDEGYRQGVQDERTSEANIGIAGFGAKVEPARQNPYGTNSIEAKLKDKNT